MKAQLLKAAGVIAGLTLVSRILGMIRDIVSAGHFGTSWQWDAFIYAFMLPNFMRRLVGEGALSSAFIPVYSDVTQKEGREAAERFARVVFTLLFWLLISLLAVSQIVLLVLLKVFSLPPVFRLTSELLQVLFPYLFFISLSALSAGILNCHRHFLSPALSPVILDVVWIAGVLWVVPMGGVLAEDQVFWLAVSILVSGAIQLGIQVPPLLRCGFTPRFSFDFRHPGLVRVGRLMLPAILGFAIMQINLLVDMTLGFWVGAGANSSLWYGNRLMQFPLGIFAIAMGTALLPTISHHAARQEIKEAQKMLSFAMRSIFFIIFPATAGLIALRVPIVQLLFERGEFDALSTVRTASVLLYYTIGLFAYSGQKLIVTGFYALEDTKTPMKVGAWTLFLNIVFNLILMGPMKESGLALATSISGIFNFLALIYLFQKRIAGFPLGEILKSSGRILAASLITGGLTAVFYQGIYGAAPVVSQTVRLLVSVFGSMAGSALVYLGLSLLFRVSEVREALAWFRESRRKGGIPASEEPL